MVPAGSFEMGSPSWQEGREENEGPSHCVTISEPFAVGVHEVTRGEWTGPNLVLITYCVPWKGTVPQRVRIPPGKLSLSR